MENLLQKIMELLTVYGLRIVAAVVILIVGRWVALGVARIMTNPGGESPEFAVLVGDPWQGQGVGAKLMEHLLAIARERQLESISGIILGTNRNMLPFARKFGFKIVKVPGEPEYEVYIDLKSEHRVPMKREAV